MTTSLLSGSCSQHRPNINHRAVRHDSWASVERRASNQDERSYERLIAHLSQRQTHISSTNLQQSRELSRLVLCGELGCVVVSPVPNVASGIGSLTLRSFWAGALNEAIRYTHLIIDYTQLLTVRVAPLDLPRAKGQYRTDRRPYQEWDTLETRQRVAEVFSKEIEYFGWPL
jgi:hypothetical protein